MDWIDKLNNELQERRDELSTPEAKREGMIRMAKWAGSQSKPSTEAKKKLSDLKKKQRFSQQHKEALKKSKLKYKITKEQILESQSKFEFNKDRAKYLGITFNTYKSIAKFHGVYQTNDVKSMGRINGMNSSNAILVWKWDKQSKTKGKFIGEFPSISEANRQLGTTGSGLSNVAKGKWKQVKGYYAEFK